MNTYILLSGFCWDNGFFKTSAAAITKVIDDTEKVLFIASRGNTHKKNDENVNRINSWFAKIGINFKNISLIDDRKSAEEQQAEIIVAKNVFLMGGDTLAQINTLRSNGLIPLLLKHRYPIMGMSAGAINMAKRSVLPLTPIRDRSWVFEGIGLVNVSITPHFDITRKKHIESEVLPMSYEGTIYGLEENGTILIQGDNIEYYGTIYEISKGRIRIINE